MFADHCSKVLRGWPYVFGFRSTSLNSELPSMFSPQPRRLACRHCCPLTLTRAQASRERRLRSSPRAKPSPDFSLASWQVERERRKLKKDFLRASRTGLPEISEATASSPILQVYLFSLTTASGEPNLSHQKQPSSMHIPDYPCKGRQPLLPLQRAPPAWVLPHPARPSLPLTQEGGPASGWVESRLPCTLRNSAFTEV